MQVNEESKIAIPADANDPEDRDVSAAGLERAQVGRRIRMVRQRLGFSQTEFARCYGIPAAMIRQYEIGRTMPPPPYARISGEADFNKRNAGGRLHGARLAEPRRLMFRAHRPGRS